MSLLVEFEVKKRQSETLALRNLYRYIILTCERIRHCIVKKLIYDTDDDEIADDVIKDTTCHTRAIIENFATEKLRALLAYLRSEFSDKKPDEICCLIFVERRYTAKCLYHIIQKYVQEIPKLCDSIRPQFMVGRNSVLSNIETILENKRNESAIKQFRTGECNLIICSNVLEEGIDIQACNYVFAFDKLKTFSSYIQTKGRARSTNSRYILFAPKNEEKKIIDQIRKYNEIHEKIKKFLIGRILDRDDPKEEIIAEQFIDVIPPYVVPNGATLLSTTALQLLNRYTQMLPWDAFGVGLPWFTKQPCDEKPGVVVNLKLPMQSTLKETLVSDRMETTKLAKISVAFKACVELHKRGELNDKLLPITKRECVQKVSAEFFEHWAKYDDDVTKRTAGKQNRRVYERMCPEELYAALPTIGEKCYAYEIKFSTQFQRNEYNEHVYEMLGTTQTYALLLRKRLPYLAEMPLYINQGKFKVKIADDPIECYVKNENEMEKLRNFHLMIFRDILKIVRDYMVLDSRNMENSYYIIPTTNNSIDWDLINNFQKIERSGSYSIADREKAIYRPEDFLGKVINKWYTSGSDVFVVTKVLTDTTPLSPFETSNYKNYKEFFESKYGQEIGRVVHDNQFMLEVKQLTQRRNFFINAQGKSGNINKKMSAIKLLPETCHNFQYPGNMWLKGLILPSILYRLQFMLHADYVRRDINAFLGLNDLANTCEYKPKPLIVDASLRRATDVDGNAMIEEETPKKTLYSLPTKESQIEYEMRSLTLGDNAWKPYCEPLDITRNSLSLFPVEIDYYYKFISGVALNLDKLQQESDEVWTKSELNMPVIKSFENPSTVNDKSTLLIMDTPFATKCRMEILERSINSVAITPAEQYEFLAGLTTSGANDVFDMERFELLGDSFLKFSISLYLVNKYPDWHEGFLTEVKSKIVSNRNLLYCMLNTDLPKRVCCTLFKPTTEWLPPLISLPRNVLNLLNENESLQATFSPSDLFNMDLCEDEVRSGMCSQKHFDSLVCSLKTNKEMFGSAIEMTNDANYLLNRESIADKTMADTLEALLGVVIKNYGIHNGFRMLKYFGLCKSNSEELTTLLDLQLKSTSLRTNISQREIDGFLINFHNLEENLGYKFRDRAYLLQALTHPSYPTNRITGCYQELEYIGDAILDFLVSCYIFERHQDMTPGKLTDLRSALVNNITLGCICVRHRFHLFLLAENSILAESIKNFADFQETQDYRVTDQVRILMEEVEISAGKDTASYNISENVEVPKALGDIVEAIIAAVYLDCRDLKTTWHVIYHLLEQEFNEFSMNVPKDPVRLLFEHKFADPKFTEGYEDNGTVMVKCNFTCLDKSKEVNGFGFNTKEAKKSAAKHALQFLARYSR